MNNFLSNNGIFSKQKGEIFLKTDKIKRKKYIKKLHKNRSISYYNINNNIPKCNIYKVTIKEVISFSVFR